MTISSYDDKAKRPEVGSWWVWERDKPGARALIKVTAVIWNGEEWWVRTIRQFEESQLGGAPGVLNDLGRFWEACLPVGPAQTRSGLPRRDEIPAREV